MKYVLIALALYQGLNGLVMLAAPEIWYQTVPGVTHTGPANIHFIRDIGLAFLGAAGGLLLAARGVAPAAALLAPALFLGGHALLHLAEMVGHGTNAADAARDTVLIVIPGLLPAAMMWLRPLTRRETA